jgi:hypothetical protein
MSFHKANREMMSLINGQLQRASTFKASVDADHLFDSLRKAGLPEKLHGDRANSVFSSPVKAQRPARELCGNKPNVR